MTEKNENSEWRNHVWSRRKAIRTAAAASVGVPILSSVSKASDTAQEKADPPKPYPSSGPESNDPDSPIYFTHITEFESEKQSLNRYEATGEPVHLFHHPLLDKLQENPDQSTFNLVVNTMGERTSMTRDTDHGRTLYGFRPTQSEVRTLAQFGDVTHVGDLVSTKVCLRNVARSDIARIAHLPSVVQIDRMPGPVTPNSVDVSDVVGSSWDQFTSAHGNYSSSSANIGVIGAGYDYETYGDYASNYAKDIGLDTSLSKDFTEESDPFNTTDSGWGDHTTNVADTAAYMLKDGDTHSDLFVSLKIVSDSTGFTDEQVRQAIEYATKKGIDVLNMSFGLNSWRECPSKYCEELSSYTADGIPVAAVGNKDHDSKVEYPACSWLTVGTGGVAKKDSNGNAVAVPDTEYGDIWFYDPFEGTTYCSWCDSASGDQNYSFSPEVYGVSKVDTDASAPVTLDGTSYACPQVAATAWINFADGGIDSYRSAMSKFKNMGEYDVVNNDEDSDAAKEGDLMEADYYF